jgi:hypothetical protein
MLASKLIEGIIVIDHGAFRRAYRPRLAHRILLLWTFRYFPTLPTAVLARWQKGVLSAVVKNGVLAPLPQRGSNMIIGTAETRSFAFAGAHRIPPRSDWEYIPRETDRKGVSA